MKPKAEFKNGSWTQFKNVLCVMAGVLLLFLIAVNGMAQSFTVLRVFSMTNGASKSLACSGTMLYGATGEIYNNYIHSTLYSVATNGLDYTVLKESYGTNVDYLTSSMVSGSTLYGLVGSTWSSGVFKINTDGSGYTVLNVFKGYPSDGAQPNVDLVLSGTTLYGTTSKGGSSNIGTVFRVNTDGSGYSILKQFGGSDGSPVGGLVLSGATLYGTTGYGGSYAGGTLFKINTDGSGYTVIKSFPGNGSESCPFATLILSGATLYGTTSSAGQQSGTVFKINIDGSGYTILKQFSGGDGSNPHSALVRSGTMLYGTTFNGGSAGYGTIFQVDTNGSHFAVLKHCTPSEAGYPGGLVMSGTSLYGVGIGGGLGGGILFSLSLIPPTIMTPPQSQTAVVGATVDLAVAAAGDPVLTYQWFFNSTNPIIGGTNLSLVLTNAQFSQSGAYTVVVTNLFGSATSSPAILNVIAGPPTILVSPLSQTVVLASNVQFSVAVYGSMPLSYQWYFNFTNTISGATNSLLELANLQLSQSGAYTVVVTNVFGAVTSAPALLAVFGVAPSLAALPADQTARKGTTVDFSASANGSLPLSYQWLFNGTNIMTGGTQSVLHLVNVQFSQTGVYTVVVTNAFGVVTSTPAMLFVPPPGTVPICTEQALRLAMSCGGPVTFACNGTITLSNTITIGSDTAIDGSGHQITISGGNTVRVFYVATNVNFKVVNLTIANGRSDSGAGIFNNGGTVTATNCHFVANLAQGASGTNGSPGQNAYGGAVYNSGVLSAINCMFHGNSVVGGTGGFGSYNSPLLTGGAGGVGDGGAICSFGALSLTGCTLATNSALGGAGGVGRTGQVEGYGGTGGAGGHGNGGALFNGGSAYLVNNTVALNTGAGGQGGAGGTGGPAGSPDYSGGDGGNGGAGGSGYSAIYDINSQCYLTNCTVALNWATNGIGGFGGQGGCNCQFPGEPRHTGRPGSGGPNGTAVGGGIRTTAGLLVNTLLSANAPSNCSGTITDAGHNLSSDTSCGFTSLDSMNNTDPKLGPLADNGGPTLTMALLPGSPAIDAGDNASAPPTDQRGVVRPYGVACDIGAYEYNLPNFPIIAIPPPTQTAEDGCVVNLTARVTGYPPPTFQWFFNGNAIIGCTNSVLCLSGVQTTNIGAYTVVVSNVEGVVTSSPAMLNVIAPVERRPVPGIKVTGETGSSLNVEYASSLSPSSNWTTLGSVSLTSTSQFCPDLTMPLPPARFYRAWQTGTPGVVPSLNLNFVPAIMLTGKVGDSLHLDCINAIGPTNDWVTLATVTLTNTSQLYFDVSAPGQSARLYRIVPAP